MADCIARAFALELGLALPVLTLAPGCQPVRGDQPRAERPAPVPSSSVSVVPRPASSFEEHGNRFVQRHPRLPDSGEWRCADRDGVVWCAGGQAPAGVAQGAADARFRCGPRWGKAPNERVCIDTTPDYPNAVARDCRFEQERGIERWCKLSELDGASLPLPARAAPGCWLDRDCAVNGCDRGVCRCERDLDCQAGRCRAGHCSREAP